MASHQLPNPPPLTGMMMPQPYQGGGHVPLLSHVNQATDAVQYQQQQELEIYFAEKGLQHLLVRAVEKLLLERPENPVEYLIAHLVETYPEQAGRFKTGLTPRASPASTPPQAQRHQRDIMLDQSMLSDAEDDDHIALSEVQNQPRMPSPVKSAKRVPGMSKTRDARRGSISAAPLTEEETKTAPKLFLKSEGEKHLLTREILPKYWVTANLSEEQAEKVADAMELVNFNSGDVVIQQGDEKADHYFVVRRGVCTIVENDLKVREVREGDGFGELALLYNRPRCASVIATSEKVELYRLDRTTFRVILVKSAMDRREKHCEFLSRVSLLNALDDRSRKALADALQSRTFKKPLEHVVTQGDRGSEFFIIEKGVAEVIHDEEPVDTLKEGDYFGEIALLDSSGLRAATVRVPKSGAPLTVLCIRREVFVRLLGGPLAESLKKRIPTYRRTPAKPSAAKSLTTSADNANGKKKKNG